MQLWALYYGVPHPHTHGLMRFGWVCVVQMKHHKLGQIIKGWEVTVGEMLLCLVLGAILELLSVKELG